MRAGVIGALLIDESTGQLYSLAPGQLAAAEALVAADGASDGLQLSAGRGISSKLDAQRQDCFELVTAVPLKKLRIDPNLYGAIRARIGIPADRDVDAAIANDPWAHLGTRVQLVTRGRRKVQALLSSVDSQFIMPSPTTGARTVYDNALELRTLDAAPLVQAGDGGALVVTETGDWLGVVVAGGHGVAFAAPIQPVAARLGLDVISSAAIRRHNKEVDLKAPKPKVVTVVVHGEPRQFGSDDTEPADWTSNINYMKRAGLRDVRQRANHLLADNHRYVEPVP